MGSRALRVQLALCLPAALCAAGHPAFSQTAEPDAQRLEKVVKDQQQQIDELQKRLADLERMMRQGQAPLASTQEQAPAGAGRPGRAPAPAARALPAAVGSAPSATARPSQRLELTQAQRRPEAPVELPADQEPAAPGGPPPAARPPTPPQSTPVESPEAERPKAEKAADVALIQQGAILLRGGQLQIEPAFDYTHFSSNRVAINGFSIFDAIVIGTIRFDKLERDIYTYSLTSRYGLTDRLQLEARVPYIHRNDNEILGIGTPNVMERPISGDGIGDIDSTMYYQAWLGGGDISWLGISGNTIPAVILRARGHFPTGKSPFEIGTVTVQGGERRFKESPLGTGFFGAGPGATFVWRSDPVVFFLSGGYTFNFAENQGRMFGVVNPGDTVDWAAGFNLAINDQVSFNASMQNQYIQPTHQAGAKIPGSSIHDSRVIFGSAIGLSPATTMLMSVGAGLTTDSPDFSFTISLPFTF